MDLNPFSHEFHEDPYPTYRWLREQRAALPQRAARLLGAVALPRRARRVARLGDLQLGAGDDDRAHRRRAVRRAPMMIFTDPPRHDRLRKLVNRVFTPRRIAELEPFARAHRGASCSTPLAGARRRRLREGAVGAAADGDDLHHARRAREPDRVGLRRHMDASLDRDRDTGNIPQHALAAMGAMLDYWDRLVADAARASERRPDQRAARGRDRDRRRRQTRLTDGEIVGFCSLIGVAGNETVTKLLANAAVLFARHPGEYREDPRRPGVHPERRRGGAALHLAVAVPGPGHHARRRVARRARPAPARASCSSPARRTATSASSRTPTASTCSARCRSRSASGRASTSAWARRWRASRAGSRWRSSAAASRRYTVDESRCVRVHMSNVHGYESVPFVSGRGLCPPILVSPLHAEARLLVVKLLVVGPDDSRVRSTNNLTTSNPTTGSRGGQ